MNDKIAIESLSMDLMRVAIGLHRGSYKMAKRFSEEALERCSEVNSSKLKPYFSHVLNNIKTTLKNPPEERTPEDALMYSILCKNYAITYLS